MLDERPFTAKRPVGVDATGPDSVAAQRTWAKVWIVHGLLWLALIAYCWTMWVVSGDFTPNTLGRGQEPTWYVIVVRCVEVIFGIFITGWILWHFVIGPKLRTGRFSFDGLFFLAGWLMFFQEPGSIGPLTNSNTPQRSSTSGAGYRTSQAGVLATGN